MSNKVLLLLLLVLMGAIAVWFIGGEAPGGLDRESFGGKAVPLVDGDGPRPGAIKNGGSQRRFSTGDRPGGENIKQDKDSKRLVQILVKSVYSGSISGATVAIREGENGPESRGKTGDTGIVIFKVDKRVGKLSATVDMAPFAIWKGIVDPSKGVFEILLKRGGVVTGRVLDKNGRPAQWAQISANKGSPIIPNKEGYYKISRLIPGKGLLACILGGEKRVIGFRLMPGETKRIDFDFAPSGVHVTGFLDNSNGLPMAKQRILAEMPGRKAQIRGVTGENGAFDLELPGPGKTRILIETGGKGDSSWLGLGEFHVPAQGLSGLRLRLGRVVFSGLIEVENNGEIPSGTTLTVWLDKGDEIVPVARTSSFKEKRFSISGLLPGQFRIGLTAQGFPDLLTWIGKVESGPHDVGTLFLTKRGTGDLRIICKGKGGPPPAELKVWRYSDDALLPVDLAILGNNKFIARLLPAGPVKLRIEAPGFVPGEPEIEIKPSICFSLTLEFIKGHPIYLEIHTTNGQSPKTVLGKIGSSNVEIEAKKTPEGFWLFPALPGGRYTLLVGSPGFCPQSLSIQVPAVQVPAYKIVLSPR